MRDEASGYLFAKRASFLGIVGITGAANASENINSLPPREQVLWNVIGVGVAVVSANGFNRQRKKAEKAASIYEKLVKQLED